MAPSPFKRRKAAKTVRNLAIAEAALALAKDRVGGKGSRGKVSGKLLLAGGAVAAAAGAAALLGRDKVAGLLPSRSGEPEPVTPAPPQPSNYDVRGPVANTATPIPAPDPQGEQPHAIDEAEEEAAAAAEAGAIGGTTSDYAGSEPGETADEAQLPLAEAGQGESEGQEQAEAELADNATYRDAGLSDTERQIGDAIEQAGQPAAGETPDPLVAPGGGISGRPFSGLDADEESGSPAADAVAGTGDATSGAGDDDAAPGDATSGGTGGGDTAVSDTSGGASGDATSGDDAEAGDATAADDTGSKDATSVDAPTGDDAKSGDEQEPAGSGGDPAAGGDSSSGDDDWRTWSGRSVNP